MKIQTACLSIAATILAAPASLAGTTEPAPVQIEPAASSGNWEFELGLYGFIAGIDGTVSAGTQTATIEFNIDDILDHLDSTIMMAGSAKKDRFKISGDLLYLGISGAGSAQGPIYEVANVELDTLVSTVDATYTIWEGPSSFLEIGAGVRYLGMDTKVGVFDTNGPFPGVFESSNVDIWDGLAVLRFGHQFSEKWFFRFSGDVGAGDSDLTWQVFGASGYAVRENAIAFLGYRYLDYDFGKGPVDLDLSISGPQLGLVFTF